MQPARVILDHVRLLSSHPHTVVVTEVPSNPITFEIRVCKNDFDRIVSREHNIRAACYSLAGLGRGEFLLTFLVCECL